MINFIEFFDSKINLKDIKREQVMNFPDSKVKSSYEDSEKNGSLVGIII